MENKKLTARDVCASAAFTAITAAMAQIAFPLPFTPVPVSLGTAAVFAAGMMLSPRRAFMSQIAYLLLGAAGLPVFAYFRGGFDAFIGPTGGYLWAYPVMAFFISHACRLAERARKKNFKIKFITHVINFFILSLSMVVCYLSGSAWLARVMSVSLTQALALGALPYVAADAVKIIFCVIVTPQIKKTAGRFL